MMKLPLFSLLCAVSLAQAAPPSVEDFQRRPAFASPALSPDGSHVAAIMTTPDGMTTLAVIPSDKPNQATGLHAFGLVDIASVHWVNDKRIAFTIRSQDAPYAKGIGYGLWTIERDGSNLQQWVDPEPGAAIFSSNAGKTRASRMQYGWRLSAIPLDGSDNIILAFGDWRMRLNAATGERQPFTRNDAKEIFEWVSDAQFQPLFGYQRLEQDRWQVVIKDADGSFKPWSVAEQPLTPPNRVPRWVDRKGNLYLLRPGGGPAARATLHRAAGLAPDAATAQILSSPIYDILPEPVLDSDSGETVGVRYETDIPRTLWLNNDLAAAQEAVDRQLPGSVNQLDCSRCLSVPTLLVTSRTDQRPPRYFLYDRSTQRLSALAASRPWLPVGSPQLVSTVPARDGRPIPVLLTRPAGAVAPAPTVLLIHAGPWVRGNHWGWEPDSQLYASRGYLVLEADYRGSLGYGTQHLHAGFRQWGQAMQDDLDDALAWAVKEGLADPSRVCAVGAGYGGYAALMEAVRSEKSGRLACAAAAFAPTDLQRLESRHWSYLSSEIRNLTMPLVIGDAKRDEAMLQASSPLLQAARIHAPVLLAYGERDRRVPLAHGSDLRDRLAAQGRPPEWITYEEPGHGVSRIEQRIDLLKRIDAFLATHLAPKN